MILFFSEYCTCLSCRDCVLCEKEPRFDTMVVTDKPVVSV